MMLTTHIKEGRVSVVTGETSHVFYTEDEWAEVLSAREVQAVENAQYRKSSELRADAQAAVDAIVHPSQIQEMQLRAMELLEMKLDGGLFQAEADELAAIKAIRAEAKAIRAAAAEALVAVAAAKDIGSIEAVTL